MILSELLELRVLAGDEEVGRVVDARFVVAETDGDAPGRPELLGLVVGRRRGPVFLGYERRSTDRPALVNRYFAWRQRDTFLVDWSDVRDISDVVHLMPGFARWSPQL
ncbi:MAG: hypothetical protein ACJ71Z_06005 [Aeromicrobium sp.]